MSSPRSMWSGVVELGLVNIPVTLGKAVDDKSESLIKQVCRCHHKPIDARWRCSESHELCTDTVAAVQISESAWREIDEQEMASIEDETNSKILTVLDVQPMDTLPMMYASATYYVRHDQKSKMRPDAMATLVAAMHKENFGLIVKWGNATSEKLCVLSVESGVLILRVIPFWDKVRIASKAEREHFKGNLQKRNVEKMSELLNAMRNPAGFRYTEYADHGAELRTEVIERILNGEQPKSKPAPPKNVDQADIFEIIDKAVAEVRG